MHGLQSAVSKRCPSNSEHVALTYRTIPSLFSIWMARRPCRSQRHVKRLATRICLDISSLRTKPITTLQPSSARVDVIQPTPARRHLSCNTSSPAPLVILSRIFLPVHLSWPPNIGQSCRICSGRLMYCR